MVYNVVSYFENVGRLFKTIKDNNLETIKDNIFFNREICEIYERNMKTFTFLSPFSRISRLQAVLVVLDIVLVVVLKY